jgi:hypothetical protein
MEGSKEEGRRVFTTEDTESTEKRRTGWDLLRRCFGWRGYGEFWTGASEEGRRVFTTEDTEGTEKRRTGWVLLKRCFGWRGYGEFW